jgi:chlorobactene glucosyltransferase
MALALLTLLFLASLASTYWFHNQWRLDVSVEPDPNLHQERLVSLIIPARNEARNIRRCVEALLAQSYSNIEVIVLDDRSEDDTPKILAELAENDHRLKLLQGKPLTPGWAGKPHALVQAAAAAQGDWLCFIDADTFAEPGLIEAALASALRHKADLFSIFTGQDLVTFWERVVMPLVFTSISVGYPPKRVNDPAKPDAIANGQFILIRREVYEAVNGHHAVWDQIIEDQALAAVVKDAGHRLVLADGRSYARTRMYTSLPEIWEGWTKNIYLGLADKLGLLISGGLGLFLSTVLFFAWPVGALIWVLNGGGWQALLALVEALVFLAYLLNQRVLANRGLDVPGGYAVFLPLASALLGAMMWASTLKVLSGRGVTWKGRTYT